MHVLKLESIIKLNYTKPNIKQIEQSFGNNLNMKRKKRKLIVFAATQGDVYFAQLYCECVA